jgi:hypothetical protein
MVSCVSKKTVFLMFLSVVFIGSSWLDAAELSLYEKGTQFGQLTARYFVQLAKKDKKGIAEIDQNRVLVSAGDQANCDWTQGAYDAYSTADINGLITAAELKQDEKSCAYIMYYSALLAIEKSVISLGGHVEKPLFADVKNEADGAIIFVKAAEAVYNNSSDESVAAVREAFDMFICFELQGLSSQEGEAAEA